ncbi:amino acid adenylation domain-containing protein [Acaryochloris thomasi]|uniref:amino acid adenylation domain-containing protein n=1 Tax=Acaryochloris thomasi TaxID=2929456 RepID=UPI003D663A3C
MVLEKFPLLPNGKVDRKALPHPEYQPREKPVVAPRNQTETDLVQIWQRVLNRQDVGIEDSFFELGGHSMLATQVITNIQTHFGIDLPLRQIFETPTISGLAASLNVQHSPAESRISQINRAGDLPLSFAQQRLWFLEQLETTGATYHITTKLHLQGHLQLTALQQSLDKIVERHEILRTRFIAHEGQPTVVIDPARPLDLPIIDLEGDSRQQQSEQLKQLLEQDTQASFDLAQGPLLRVKIVRVGLEDAIAIVTLHHIIADGSSTQIFLRELTEFYQTFSQGQELEIPQLPLQYVDYAHWQRQNLQGEFLATQLEYWQQQLTPLPASLDLPFDRPRPPTQTYAGETFNFKLSSPTDLRALAPSAGTTPYMVLLAVFKVLLYRYTGQTDIAIGSPIVNRNNADIEGLIGLFANTLVLRTDLAGNPSFSMLLQRVKDVALDAYAHPDLPLEKLVEELQLPRDLSHSPLFQVMFAHQTAPGQVTVPGLTITPDALATHTAKFDLTLTITETEAEITGVLEYNTDQFDLSTIERLAGHYQTLLEAIIKEPEQSIGNLPLLTALEQQQFIQGAQTQLPQWSGLHRWFEHQVEQTPESIALEFKSQTLTYAELNAQANQLARYLLVKGIAPEDRVGLLLNRSPEMVVALLAVLKAGGTYLPLDPAYPIERLRYMVADAQVKVLITDGEPLIESEVVINGAIDRVAIAKQTTQNLGLTTFPEQLAYVIYTSGSTGKPKGVQITHQAVINFLTAHGQSPGITADDVMFAVTSLSFDIAVLELLLPLVNGAKVLLASREMALDGIQLGQSLQQATLMQATPATWRLLLASGWTGQQHLKILSGGEALSSDLAAQLITCGSELWNLYGPTETTIWSTQQAVLAKEAVGIGFAIANTQVYILDSHLQQVPTGVTGELYIGGLGLARGYHQRPGLSAERFIPNPFSNKPGARLYRTGDLACVQKDGSIRHLGRIDDQVKVRGFRIELGEIETCLNQHPLITQAVVISAEGADTLVAYGQLQEETEPKLNELQQWLRISLPDYMMPAQFIWVSEFPLTPNGKLDRRALASTEGSNSKRSHAFVTPQTPTEKQLAQIWIEILGIEQAGVDDNFFELGGHSLLATQVVSRIRSHFSVELPLQLLFSSPTIATLATHIDLAPPLQSATRLVPISRQQPLPLSFAQERLWFMDQLTPGNSAYNEPAIVLLEGRLDIAALQSSLNVIVERHEILRTTFCLESEVSTQISEIQHRYFTGPPSPPILGGNKLTSETLPPELGGRGGNAEGHACVGGQPVQLIAESLTLNIPVVDLQDLTLDEQELVLEKLAIANTQTPFTLSQGPLLRTKLLKLDPEKHVLLFTMHHIIADGWSKGVLIQDLSQLYTQIVSKRDVTLPPLPIQYADFAFWQRQQDLEPQLTYWRQQLGGDLPTLALPLDSPRPAQRSDQGVTVSLTLSPHLSEALVKLSQQEDTTLFMTLMAGFKILLSCHTQQRDIWVGTDVANRIRSELEGLIGFFVNLLVLRTDLSGNPSFKALLQRVKTVALGAYDHQDIPFAQLVDVLQPERQEGLLPLFQVLFVLQNAPMPAIELPDLKMTPTQPEAQVAKFDLALFIQETPEGLVINWNYSTDVFQDTTINRLAQQYTDLLQKLVEAPETSIEAIISQFTAPPPKRKRFQRQKNRAVSPTEVVGFSTHPTGVGLYQPQLPAVNLAAWAQEQRPQLEQQLQQSGALLFRGFDIPDASAFEDVAKAMCPELFGEYGDLPRTEVGGKVYGSTPYPDDRAILFHNESSHLEQWPMKIWFFCVQPSVSGGETPIVDCRQLYQRLRPEVRDRFAQKKLMYERNFVPGLDVSWQDFFQTDDRTVVEWRCQSKGVECIWLEDGGLRTRQVRDAIATHPQTQDQVFFNQLQLHHFSYIDPETQASLRSLLGGDCLPRQVYYGDGSEIEPEVLAEVNAAYQVCAQQFTWQKGDVLMLDNMLMAHGRQPYTGTRKIVVALGQMIDSPSTQSAT